MYPYFLYIRRFRSSLPSLRELRYAISISSSLRSISRLHEDHEFDESTTPVFPSPLTTSIPLMLPQPPRLHHCLSILHLDKVFQVSISLLDCYFQAMDYVYFEQWIVYCCLFVFWTICLVCWIAKPGFLLCCMLQVYIQDNFFSFSFFFQIFGYPVHYLNEYWKFWIWIRSMKSTNPKARISEVRISETSDNRFSTPLVGTHVEGDLPSNDNKLEPDGQARNIKEV